MTWNRQYRSTWAVLHKFFLRNWRLFCSGVKVTPERDPPRSEPMTRRGSGIHSGKCPSRLGRRQLRLRGTPNGFACLSKCVYGLCCFPQADHFLKSNESCERYGWNPSLGRDGEPRDVEQAHYPSGTRWPSLANINSGTTAAAGDSSLPTFLNPPPWGGGWFPIFLSLTWALHSFSAFIHSSFSFL